MMGRFLNEIGQLCFYAVIVVGAVVILSGAYVMLLDLARYIKRKLWKL